MHGGAGWVLRAAHAVLPPDSLPAGVGIRLFGRWSWWWSMLRLSGSFPTPLRPLASDRHCAIKWGPACRLGVLSKERRGDDMDGMADRRQRQRVVITVCAVVSGEWLRIRRLVQAVWLYCWKRVSRVLWSFWRRYRHPGWRCQDGTPFDSRRRCQVCGWMGCTRNWKSRCALFQTESRAGVEEVFMSRNVVVVDI